LAADLGGTKCRFALVSEDLAVHGAREVATTMNRSVFLQRMDDAFRELAKSCPDSARPAGAIGVGAAGIVRVDAMALVGAPNLPIDRFPIGENLQSAHGLPTTLLNDGRASAWGEYLRGHAKGSDPLLVLFFGTGIGIGLIAGGAPFSGAQNAAGEVGHTIYRPGGRRCVCGNYGCYEAYCGGGPLALRATEDLGALPGGARWTVTALREHALVDARARAILDEAQTAACAMVASLCTLLNPAAVVLGGGVIGAWPALAAEIEAFVRRRCSGPVVDDIVFSASVGGSNAILWGAAAATGHF